MVAPIVAALIEPLSGIVGDLIDRAFPNSGEREQKKLEYQAKILDALNSNDLAQMEVNKVEAASGRLFVSGWRPFIGWVCGAAFAYHFVIQPFIAFAISSAGYAIVLPAFDMGELSTVLMGMLGLGGMRSFEKIKGAVK